MVDHTPPAAAGFHATLLPLTARMAARITTYRLAPVSPAALADELLDLIARYVDETAVEALDPRLQAIVAKAALRALELVEQRTAAARAAKRAAQRAADDLVVVLDVDQLDLEAAGVPLCGGRHMNKTSERHEPADGRRGAYAVGLQEISDSQRRILQLLDEHGHRTAAEICAADNPRWHGLYEWGLGRLVAAGYVAGEDLGGPTMYALTPAGRDALAEKAVRS